MSTLSLMSTFRVGALSFATEDGDNKGRLEKTIVLAGDAQLIAWVKAKDHRALMVLYGRYSAIVYSCALRVVRNVGVAEQILQEVFLEIWRDPKSFEAYKSYLPGWLAVKARHRGMDHLRGTTSAGPEADKIQVGANPPPLNGTKEEMPVRPERSFSERLNRLPDAEREVLELAFLECLTHREISKKTGRPLDTVKAEIRSALLAIHKMDYVVAPEEAA